MFRYESKYKKVGVLPIRIVKSNVSSEGPQRFFLKVMLHGTILNDNFERNIRAVCTGENQPRMI